MEPEKIRTLLAATPERLEKVAKKMELPLPIARDIRVQAMNLILGKCVLCGKRTLAGMCGHCKKDAGHRRMIPWAPIKFLKLLDPSDQLLRQTCSSCGGPFMLSARFLLRNLLAKNPQKLKETCNTCVEKAREAARKVELQKWEEERKRQVEENRRAYEERKKRREEAAQREAHRHQAELERAPHLLHNPFAGNAELEKLRKELPRAPRSRRGQNRSKRA